MTIRNTKPSRQDGVNFSEKFTDNAGIQHFCQAEAGAEILRAVNNHAAAREDMRVHGRDLGVVAHAVEEGTKSLADKFATKLGAHIGPGASVRGEALLQVSLISALFDSVERMAGHIGPGASPSRPTEHMHPYAGMVYMQALMNIMLHDAIGGIDPLEDFKQTEALHECMESIPWDEDTLFNLAEKIEEAHERLDQRLDAVTYGVDTDAPVGEGASEPLPSVAVKLAQLNQIADSVEARNPKADFRLMRVLLQLLDEMAEQIDGDPRRESEVREKISTLEMRMRDVLAGSPKPTESNVEVTELANNVKDVRVKVAGNNHDALVQEAFETITTQIAAAGGKLTAEQSKQVMDHIRGNSRGMLGFEVQDDGSVIVHAEGPARALRAALTEASGAGRTPEEREALELLRKLFK